MKLAQVYRHMKPPPKALGTGQLGPTGNQINDVNGINHAGVLQEEHEIFRFVGIRLEIDVKLNGAIFVQVFVLVNPAVNRIDKTKGTVTILGAETHLDGAAGRPGAAAAKSVASGLKRSSQASRRQVP